MFYREKPVDWLLEHILYTKVCNPEKDMKECAHEKRKIKVTYITMTCFFKTEVFLCHDYSAP